MRALNVGLSLLVSAAIALGVLEAGLRLIGKGPPPSVLRFDPRVGWEKRPGLDLVRRQAEGPVRLVTNSAGLQDDEPAAGPKPAGTFRVLALGDSFTQGFTVERRHLFVDLLERWWRAEGRVVEVVNAGCEAYSTDQEVAWLFAYGERVQPDLVLLFPYDNDLYWHGERAYMYQREKPLFEAYKGVQEPRDLAPWPEPGPVSRLACAWLLGYGRPRDVARHVFLPPGGKRPILKEFAPLLKEPQDFMAPALARTSGALLAFKAGCAKLNARGIIVPIPSHSAIDPSYRERFGEGQLGLPASAWSPDLPVEAFLSLSRDAGLETLDPRQAFKDSKEPLYFPTDWHLNPAGNAAFAAFLHGELDRLGVFPAEHAARQVVAAPPAAAEEEESAVPFALFLFGGLWVALTALYWGNYADEPRWQVPLKIAALLAVVFGIVIGGQALIGLLPPAYASATAVAFVLGILFFVAWKLGRRLGTILELLKSFTLRGHWYLMPLVVVLLTVGSLLVVAASSPLVAPFIYTLF